ncbi:MAG: amidohydrolase family protein, partial [Bryobacterales bacterium]|nr:amidohydrolase family protein [Bryobacterales bacterium]
MAARLGLHPLMSAYRASWIGALLSLAIFTVPAAPQVTAIAGATVFDSITGTALPNHTVLIERDRIRSVAPRRSVAIPKGASVIDAKGKHLIPGLIDGHVHLMHVLDFAHVTADEVLPLFLAHGVTTLRDTGDQVYAEKLLARHAEQRPESCPRIMLCSPLLDADPPFHKDIGYPLVDPDKVPDVVADMKAWGVTTLKLYVGMTRPVGQRIIDEGHRHGLVVTGHLGRYSAQDAVADGIDSLEHIWSVFNFILPPTPTTPAARLEA